MDALIKRADTIKLANYVEYLALVAQLDGMRPGLSVAQVTYLDYLHGWQLAYEGRYADAIPVLRNAIADSTDVTLKFRAGVTIANVFLLAKQYEQSFAQLGQLLALLPETQDQDARIQGLSVASALYNQVGEYELGMRYAQQLIDEYKSGKGACYGRQLYLDAQYKSTKAQTIGPEYQLGIDECVRAGEASFANLIRSYLARLYVDHGRVEDAIALLKANYAQVERSQYRRLISEFDAVLASAYRQRGETSMARQFALQAVEHAVENEYTRPLVAAYQLLYSLAKEQGDAKAALAYHEKYTAADKGYLDDLGSRQLAYQRVKHEVDANKLQIEGLNKANQVLQLQRELSQKAVENIRLYIILLFVILVFIALWAYKTKRSQMHFKNLSRLDGLTGLCNRPHFMNVAERALADGLKSGQPICVIICDLDYFKRINDTFGHAAGDSALKKTATVFQAHLRKQDIVGRLGGEEFAMVLINCDAAAAVQRCDQMRVAIATVSVGEGAGAFSLTASFGIVSTMRSGHELRQLLADADAALYQAKLSGRNRVIQFSSSNVTTDDEPDSKTAGLTPSSA